MRHFKDIGALDRILTIRKKTDSGSDIYGHPTIESTVDIDVNAAYSFASKDEQNELEKETQYEKLHFVIRYFSGLSLEHKAVFESNVYDIINIMPIGRRYLQKITLKRVD